MTPPVRRLEGDKFNRLLLTLAGVGLKMCIWKNIRKIRNSWEY